MEVCRGSQTLENWWVRTLKTRTGKYAGEGSIIAQDDAEGGRSVGRLTTSVVEAMDRNVPRLSVSFVTSNLWLRLIVSEEGQLSRCSD